MYKPSQVGKVDSTPFVQVTSLFPLKVNPPSQVTVYLLPEVIVADEGDTVPSAIVGLLQEFAENTILLRNGNHSAIMDLEQLCNCSTENQ